MPTELDECPICGVALRAGEHYFANPDSAHSYHTDKKTVARRWEHRDGLDVTPTTDPYPHNTPNAEEVH